MNSLVIEFNLTLFCTTCKWQIVQLAAYTPTDHFEQYIMPYMNLNPAARQRHQVRVISIGFFRMLKSMQTYKVPSSIA